MLNKSKLIGTIGTILLVKVSVTKSFCKACLTKIPHFSGKSASDYASLDSTRTVKKTKNICFLNINQFSMQLTYVDWGRIYTEARDTKSP